MSLTGKRGDRIIIDDPHDIPDAMEAMRRRMAFEIIAYGYATAEIAAGEKVVIIVGQSGGQLADIFSSRDVLVAPDFEMKRQIEPPMIFEGSNRAERRRAGRRERVKDWE